MDINVIRSWCTALLALAVVTSFYNCADAAVQLTQISTLYLPYDVTGPTPLMGYEAGAVEQLSYDPVDKIIYLVGSEIFHVVNCFSPLALVREASQMMPGLDLTDVEVCGDYVAITIDDKQNRSQGQLRLYRKYAPGSAQPLQHLDTVMVGSLPDMLQIMPDCKTFIIALEAEAYFADDGSLVDPEGGVVIVNYADGVEGALPATVTQLDFQAYNSQLDTLAQDGVRFVYRGNSNSFSNDIEPEYVALDLATNTAFVGLQENNAIAEVDLTAQTVTNIYGLGYKQWGSLDASDKDGIDIQNWPIRAFYLPDAIKFHQWQGRRLIITANEGDAKEYKNIFEEEIRGSKLAIDEFGSAISGAVKAALSNDTQLGRLKFSAVDGKDQNGKFQNLYTYGGRSFSIWDADNNMAQLYDSGSDFETITAQSCPHLFNTNGDDVDERSDDKGPETESLAVAEFGDRLYIFIGNERPGVLMVYSIGSDVTSPQFETIFCDGIPDTGKTMQQMFDNRELFAVDPEDMRYVPASESPASFPVLMVAGTVSNTISLLRVDYS